jgi:hypothetical protein
MPVNQENAARDSRAKGRNQKTLDLISMQCPMWEHYISMGAQCGNTTFQWVPNVGTLHFNGCPMWEHYISMGAQLGFVVRKFVAEFRVLAHKWKTTITSMPACNVLETTK